MAADMTGPGPLAGTRVVEFGGIGPAPLAGMLLADLGADVVVIERPNAGAIAEFVPKGFLVTNRGKRLTEADLKAPADLERVRSLLDRSDALIEGFRPGTMERLGLGPEPLFERNPRLVYCRVTGWGQTGPLAQTAGHDITYLAMTGALATIGRHGDPPVPPVNYLGDYAGGTMFAVTGILAGLLEARRSGRGQVVDAAMIDGVGALLAPLQGMVAAGRWRLERGRNLLDTGAPFYDVYPTADGRYLAIGALEDEFFAVLAERIGLDRGLADRRWDATTWPALRQAIGDRIAERSRDAWVLVFEGTDGCVAPVLDLAEARADGHHRSRHGFVEVAGATHPAPAPRFDRTPARVPSAPPTAATALDDLVADWAREVQ
jgi:alpha-methylacyl-CoA racemase